MDNPYLNQTFKEDIIVNRSTISENSTTKWNHYHNYYELYFFIGNNMQYFIDNNVYDIECYNIVLVDTLCLHRTLYTKHSKGERILVLINPNIFLQIKNSNIKDRIEQLFKNKIVRFDNPIILQHTMDSLNRLIYHANSPESTWKREKSLFVLTELLLSFLELPPKCFEYEKNEPSNPKEKHVYNIIDYLTNHYSDNITLDKLSSEFYIDKHYLCHIFKEITGLTVIGFLNTKRLSEAERMLLYTNLSITQICQNIGFNSMSYFIKLFRNNYHCSPSEFRKRIIE